jgi:inner membrane protein
VRLIDPVDIYRQALRAVKYGVLFIVLSFAAFFMFEHLRTLPIHPIQYLLVGLAQAVFFLLLTSLSEHIAFPLAYLAAAAASIVLIGVYLAAILRAWWRGLGFGGALTILYAALYGILRSEQNALLLGSLLLFLALAGLMLGTRKIDWYRLGKSSTAEGA